MRKRDKYYVSDEFWIAHNHTKMSPKEMSSLLNLPIATIKMIVANQKPIKELPDKRGITVLTEKLAENTVPPIRTGTPDSTYYFKAK